MDAKKSNIEEEFRQVLKQNQFIGSSFDLYNSPSGFQTYGSLGTTFKRQVLSLWRDTMLNGNLNVYEIDTPIIGPKNMYVASGHVAKFSDKIIRDQNDKVERVDHYLKNCILASEINEIEKTKLINTLDNLSNNELKDLLNLYGQKNRVFSEITEQNLMLETQPSLNSVGCLRPETAQGLITEFKTLYKFHGETLPFGIGQVGRVYRKEISTKPFTRLVEFEQAEIEIFHDPEQSFELSFEVLETEVPAFTREEQTAGKEFTYSSGTKKIGELVKNGLNSLIALYMYKTEMLMRELNINVKRRRFRQHLKNEMAHYSSDCWDMEYLIRDKSPNIDEVHLDEKNWLEVVGIADRGCYDLTQHQNFTKNSMKVKRVLSEPIEQVKYDLKLNMKEIAKTFKQSTARVKECLEKVCQDQNQCERIHNELNSNNSFTLVECGDSLTVLDSLNVLISEQSHSITTQYTIQSNMIILTSSVTKITYEEFVPHIIEPSFGIDRLIYAVLNSRYWIRPDDENRGVLSLPQSIAPIKYAILPLYNKKSITKYVKEVEQKLSTLTTRYKTDCSGASIGKRYSRMDEIGVPYSITIDYQTDVDQTVTVRDRDTTKQMRFKIDSLVEELSYL